MHFLLCFLQFWDLGVEAGRPLGYVLRRGVEVESLAGMFPVLFRYFLGILLNPHALNPHGPSSNRSLTMMIT